MEKLKISIKNFSTLSHDTNKVIDSEVKMCKIEKNIVYE